jgi:hypothetical protein
VVFPAPDGEDSTSIKPRRATLAAPESFRLIDTVFATAHSRF